MLSCRVDLSNDTHKMSVIYPSLKTLYIYIYILNQCMASKRAEMIGDIPMTQVMIGQANTVLTQGLNF